MLKLSLIYNTNKFYLKFLSRMKKKYKLMVDLLNHLISQKKTYSAKHTLIIIGIDCFLL